MSIGIGRIDERKEEIMSIGWGPSPSIGMGSLHHWRGRLMEDVSLRGDATKNLDVAEAVLHNSTDHL
jgi:hypothetical protein